MKRSNLTMNLNGRTITTAVSLLLAALLADYSFAGGDGGCGDGCYTPVSKDREIKVKCFACECKDVCLPGPSRRGCKNCDCVDCAKGSKGCCASGDSKKISWFDWCPGCARKRTKKHLMMKTVKKKVCGFEWKAGGACDKGESDKPAADEPPLPPRQTSRPEQRPRFPR